MALRIISVGTCSKLNKLLGYCMLALVASSLNMCAAGKCATCRLRPSTLKYYIHAMLDSSTAYISQPVNVEATGTFGQTAVFSYKATLQRHVNSTQVGSIRGFEVYNSFNASDPSILVLNTLTYDDGVYAGTISLHGQTNINLTTYDITVVGGTADFRGVRGYAAITNLRTPGSDHVFKHVLHFL